MQKFAFSSLSIAGCVVLGAACKSTIGGAYGNADEHANSLSVYVGARGYDDDEREPVEQQASVGFVFAHSPGVLGFEGGLFPARDHPRRSSAEFTEKTA
ncbi:MAG: hypothetical protein SGI72_17290 [Planctomycetota bacterium]|nr:hypothetical protein [Planctomycetota bacterium]